MIFQCNNCKLHVPMEDGEWPLRCRCGVKYESQEDPGTNMLSTKSKGLGDTISKVAKKFGFKECGGCGRRKRVLNKMFQYNNA